MGSKSPSSASQALGLQCAPQLPQHLLIKVKVAGNRGVSSITHMVDTVGDPDPSMSKEAQHTWPLQLGVFCEISKANLFQNN